ncbi:MAG: PorV/PorQ family protein [Elusimicrobia bacterium]|nr:PorV/PorQ family protein [Elusimicrobiota bacterium]
MIGLVDKLIDAKQDVRQVDKFIRRVFLIIILLTYHLINFAYGQDAGLPGAYLNYAGGPQVNGMGRAFVGLAEGTDAVAWNPAGLSLLRPNMISLLHTETVEQAKLDYVGYAQPLYRWGGLGLSYVRLDSGSLPETNELNQEVGRFRDLQQTWMLGYGFRPIRRVSLGTTLKLSEQRLSGASARGWGADVGALIHFKYGIRLGLRVQNLVAPALKFDTATDRFPRLITGGLAAKVLNENLAITSDIEKALDVSQKMRWRVGLEGTLWQAAKIRGGFDFNRKEFTFGLGYLWGRHGFDYASSANSIGLTHRIGITYAFGGYAVSVQARPETFSPVGLQKRTALGIQVNHTQRIHAWVLEIRSQNQDLVRSIRGSGQPPPELVWDGTTEKGTMVAAGNYIYTLTVTDVEGKTETTPPQIVRVDYGTPLDTLELQTR